MFDWWYFTISNTLKFALNLAQNYSWMLSSLFLNVQHLLTFGLVEPLSQTQSTLHATNCTVYAHPNLLPSPNKPHQLTAMDTPPQINHTHSQLWTQCGHLRTRSSCELPVFLETQYSCSLLPPVERHRQYTQQSGPVDTLGGGAGVLSTVERLSPQHKFTNSLKVPLIQ